MAIRRPVGVGRVRRPVISVPTQAPSFPTWSADPFPRMPELQLNGAAIPEDMLSGRWQFSFAPTFGSDAVPGGSLYLFNFDSAAYASDGIYIAGPRIYLRINGTIVNLGLHSWSPDQEMTLQLDLGAGEATTSGATSGNGTDALPGVWGRPDTVGVGHSVTVASTDYTGTITPPTSW